MKQNYYGMYDRECCESIIGNNLDFEVYKHDCEIKVDIEVSPSRPAVRIWGQIKDCEGNSVGNTLIKLVKSFYVCGKCEYVGIAHTISDCEGFYQFEVCVDDEEKCQYKILVSKAATGSERHIEYDGNCNPCSDPCNDHCDSGVSHDGCDASDCECNPPYNKKKY